MSNSQYLGITTRRLMWTVFLTQLPVTVVTKRVQAPVISRSHLCLCHDSLGIINLFKNMVSSFSWLHLAAFNSCECSNADWKIWGKLFILTCLLNVLANSLHFEKLSYPLMKLNSSQMAEVRPEYNNEQKIKTLCGEVVWTGKSWCDHYWPNKYMHI